jgi:hypothetical protein
MQRYTNLVSQIIHDMNNLHEFDNGSGNKNLIEYQKQATVK